MTELERLFRRLVDSLIAIDPARLHRPVGVAELVRSIIPYRTSRAALALDSVEDYDLLILRLLSEEGGFVTVRPDEVAQRCRGELISNNPDPGLLREFGGAELSLSAERLAQALGTTGGGQWAPPDEVYPEQTLEAAGDDTTDEPIDGASDVDEGILETGRVPWVVDPAPTRSSIIPLNTGAVPDAGSRCGYCGGLLPNGRQVNFCPHCGQSQTFIRCGECGNEVEFGWKHCVACGTSVGEE